MSDSLEHALSKMRENKMFSDCLILVEDQSFACHKNILAVASEFFERMFLGKFQESQSGEIRLNEVKAETFSHFLQYVYSYNKEKLAAHSVAMLTELLKLGSSWLVDSIQKDCVQILKGRIGGMTISDLVPTFQSAHDTNHNELQECCVQRLKSLFRNQSQCFISDAMALTSDAFEQYLIASGGGNVPEIERFKMIELYVKVQGLYADFAENSEDVVDAEKKEVKLRVTSEESDVEEPEPNDKPGTSKAICNSSGEVADDAVGDQKESRIQRTHLKYIKTLLGYIDYNRMTKIDFYNVVGKSNLLNDKEKYENLFLTC
ncbi:kelch repeat and BTB domain-containing protein 7-like [Drosophila ficusphila]|uniref:kelch repeat and BTB domain-containing protein 7-like n=1 Tax=Drosophila ficusphila TaxID=30025 RepID=UPI0007E7C5F4|nr:kelch repeat and BTB domain-containing protein 7-like [Drosophila ficusphila]XP_017060213.1 kelch repeat and BTB domain-containing protein 7-like [Drosophila ficusphila]XP_017060214.1 kelch repeat and BTB domain-containing protein 7-like [Drosophila ficusphila]